MKKKFAAMFMAAAMVFTMAACGQKADTPSTPDADGSGDFLSFTFAPRNQVRIFG